MYIPKCDFGYDPKNGKGRGIPEKRIIIFSGAGISQPSGISTFRDTDGLWENHKIEEICNQNTWKKNFEAVHDFYNQRRMQLNEVEPNIAHKTIAKMVNEYGKDNVYNITQNVDDLFERAGTEALHVHGELTKMECEACGNNWNIGYKAFDIEKDRCPKCDSLKGVRPKIVFFYGSAPMYEYMFNAADHTMNPESIVVIIGTMGNVIDVNSIFLQGTPCYKILVDIKLPPDIKEENLNKIILTGAEDGMLEVERIIAEKWN